MYNLNQFLNLVMLGASNSKENNKNCQETGEMREYNELQQTKQMLMKEPKEKDKWNQVSLFDQLLEIENQEYQKYGGLIQKGLLKQNSLFWDNFENIQQKKKERIIFKVQYIIQILKNNNKHTNERTAYQMFLKTQKNRRIPKKQRHPTIQQKYNWKACIREYTCGKSVIALITGIIVSCSSCCNMSSLKSGQQNNSVSPFLGRLYSSLQSLGSYIIGATKNNSRDKKNRGQKILSRELSKEFLMISKQDSQQQSQLLQHQHIN